MGDLRNTRLQPAARGAIMAIACLLAAHATACLDRGVRECSWGLLCASDMVCWEPLDKCVLPVQIEACSDRHDGDPCSYVGSGYSHRCRQGACEEPSCGDGVPDATEDGTELCDDANVLDHDGCYIYEKFANVMTRDCRNEEFRWVPVSAPGPSPRVDHAMVYAVDDGTDEGYVLLFGGRGTRDGTQIILSDTWRFRAGEWEEVHSPETPSARYNHAMAFDAVRREVVLFGGDGDLYHVSVYADTWSFDGEQWNRNSTPSTPGRLTRHAMAYDESRGLVVISGGKKSGNTQPDEKTWEFIGGTWIQGANIPPFQVRSGHSFAYCPRLQRLMVFGGLNAFIGTPLDETLTFDGVTWDSWLPLVTPSPRHEASMASDPARQTVTLFGGATAANEPMGDTWEFDGTGWIELTSDSTPVPCARYGHALVSGPTLELVYPEGSEPRGGRNPGGVLLFGGQDADGRLLGDTWIGRFDVSVSD